MTEQDICCAKFTYYCQLIYDTQKQRCGKAELLIRAWGPGGEQYPTEELIQTAERFGMIGDIDLRALQHACRTLPRYRKEGIAQLSVNVSPRSLQEGIFRKKAEALLQEHCGVCRHLVIEITEGAPGEKEDWMRPALERLRQCGVSIAVDDFGKDNAGIFRILNMPFQYIKLDKSITGQSHREPFARLVTEKLVEAMVLAGKEVVAEGVETAAQAQELLQMGVRYLQGCYWSPPVPEEVFFKEWALKCKYQKTLAWQSSAPFRCCQSRMDGVRKEAKPPGGIHAGAGIEKQQSIVQTVKNTKKETVSYHGRSIEAERSENGEKRL